jgi:hypothetical protein
MNLRHLALLAPLSLAGCGGGQIVVKEHTIDNGWIFTDIYMTVKNTGSSGTRYRYSVMNGDQSRTFCTGTGYLDSGEERKIKFACNGITQYSGKVNILTKAI